MMGSKNSKILFGLLLGASLGVGSAAFGAETVDVSLTKTKISAKSINLDHGDVLNICSRDEGFHQPYSLASPNKFGSPKAKEKDLLAKNQCRLVEVKNTGKRPIEMTVYDRFVPSAYLAFKIAPKPAAEKPAPKSEEKAVVEKTPPPQNPDTFNQPMQSGKRLAYCYSPGEGCGEKAASTWCQRKGYKGAKKWDKEASDGKAGSYIGTDFACKKGECEVFSWVTCRTGPPTFF